MRLSTLASASDLATILGTTAGDPNVILAIRRASDRFEGAIGYPVGLVEDDEIQLAGDGSRVLLLPSCPIIGTPVVAVDGEAVTDFEVGRKAGVLRRKAGWPDGLDNIVVTYTHGWTVVPGDIADAVLEMAEIDSRPHGVASVASGSESIGIAVTIQTGVTQRWSDAVEKYRLKDGRS